MVEIARQAAGCFGARMTGAGFGGCAIALVRAEKVREFSLHVVQEYTRQAGLTPSVYICQAAAGASLVPA